MKSVAPIRKRVIVLLVVFCAAATVLWFAIAAALPNIAHPDQIFQTLEPAHRLVYGFGIVPWEFRQGVRSWILPGLFAIIFKISDSVLRAPGAYCAGATVFVSLVSLSPVICGFLWAYQLGGERAALTTAGFTAIWFEIVYFATKSLSEVFSAHMLLAGLFLAVPGAPILFRRRLVVAGAFLGLALMLRIQLLPAIVVIAAYAFWIGRQPWRFLALGFAIPVIGAGLLDWATWGHPWQSVWKYVYINIILQRSEAFGVRAWYYYFLEFAVFWSVALLPMLALIWLGIRRLPLLGAVAITILVSHSFVGHKEYRFIYPAIVIFTILAGLGLSDVLTRFRMDSYLGVAACLLSVTGVSVFLAAGSSYRDNWTASEGEIRAFQNIASDTQACGILLWRQRGWTTPGYTGLHRDIPIYEVMSAAKFDKLSAAGNYVVTRTPLEDAGRFALTGSLAGASRVYVYKRPGACSAEQLSERLMNPDWYGERERNDAE